MAGFKDFMAQRQAVASGTTEPLDMGQGTRPRLTFKEYMEQKAQPQVSPETVKDVTAKPVGRPASPEAAQPTQPQPTPEAPTEAPQDTSLEAQQQQQAQQALQQSTMMGNPYAGMAMTAAQPAVQEFVKTEAIPAVTTMGAIALAPETGGGSLLAVLGTGALTDIGLGTLATATAAGIGGMAGEAAEQGLKKAGLMGTGKYETLPKDGYDILKRSVAKGKEEALWNAVPEIAVRGGSQLFKRLITKGGVFAKDEAGNFVNPDKQRFVQLMVDHANKEGLPLDKVLTTADIADTGLTQMAENVMANSYANKAMREIKEQQAAALKGEVTGLQESYQKPVKEYVESDPDRILSDYYKPNFDNGGDIHVAALVNMGLNKAQEVRKSVARGIYKTIDNSMNEVQEGMAYREVDHFDPLTGAHSTKLVPEKIEIPKFTVDTKGLKQLAHDHAKKSMGGYRDLPQEYAESLEFPDRASYEQAASKLDEWEAASRDITTSNVRKLHIGAAIKELRSATEQTIRDAHAQGVSGPDGRSLIDWKKDADTLWRMQKEDFDKSAMEGVMKAASPVNGAPQKIAGNILENDIAASRYQSIRDKGMQDLQGQDLDDFTIMDESVKGQIVKDIFSPFNIQQGTFTPPNFNMLKAKEDSLRRIFGEEETDKLKELGGILERQQGLYKHNRLAYTQATRESGTLVQMLKDVTQGEFTRAIAGGFNTTLYMSLFSKVLHNKDALQHAINMMDDTLPISIRYGGYRNLAYLTAEHQQRSYEAMDEEQKKRLNERQQVSNDYHEDIKGIHKNQ